MTERLLECLLSRERNTTRGDDTESLIDAELLYQLSSICHLYFSSPYKGTAEGPSWLQDISLPCRDRVSLVRAKSTETAQIANVRCVDTSYVEPVRQSFIFQQEITITPSGAMKPEPHAQLIHMFQAINSSQKLLRKSLLPQICSELTVTIQIAQNAMYVKYIVENLTLYPFERPEDLEQSMCHLQRVIKVQGPEIVHGSHEILEQCPASMSSEDQSLALLRTTTWDVASLRKGTAFFKTKQQFRSRSKTSKGPYWSTIMIKAACYLSLLRNGFNAW